MAFSLARWIENYYRLVSCRPLARYFLPEPFRNEGPPKAASPLKLEIVSHCWNYAHLLAYQLSSLVLFEPTRVDVTMTVFYSREDRRTVDLLQFIQEHRPANVQWKFHSVSKHQLFRRAIGRNIAALSTTADWIWFTDCDQLFYDGCLDSMADQLAQQSGVLVYPRVARCCDHLLPGDSILQAAFDRPCVVEVDRSRFHPKDHEKAIGGLQILRGDAARQVGYCDAIRFYQKPAVRWKKTYEDRAFRCLVGSQGEPIEVRNLFRIEHATKGRKDASAKAA